MKLAPYQTRFAIAVIGALLACGAYVAGTMSIGREAVAIENASRELTTQIRRHELTGDMSATLDVFARERARVDAFFGAPTEAVAVIERIEGLAVDTGAQIIVGDVHLEGAESPADEGELLVAMTAAGSWTQVIRTLALLDTLPIASAFDHVALTLDSDTEAGPVWNLRASLRVPLKNR